MSLFPTYLFRTAIKCKSITWLQKKRGGTFISIVSRFRLREQSKMKQWSRSFYIFIVLWIISISKGNISCLHTDTGNTVASQQTFQKRSCHQDEGFPPTELSDAEDGMVKCSNQFTALLLTCRFESTLDCSTIVNAKLMAWFPWQKEMSQASSLKNHCLGTSTWNLQDSEKA